MRHTFILLLLFISLAGCKRSPAKSIDDKISPAFLQEDFKEITSAIEHKVPDAYYLCSKPTYDSVKRKIIQSLNKPLSRIEFYRQVSPLFALLKDGHFYLQ